MKATVLVDNIKCGDIKGEWGLSIYIENNEKNILLDVGASPLFAENAKKLGLSIEKVDAAVLSHAHYDHSDGMKKFFEENKAAKFYLRNSAKENCYFKKFFIKKYIGIPKKILSDYENRFVFEKGDAEIFNGVWLVGHKTPNLSSIGKRENMYRKEENGWVPDDFSHEQSLVVETEKGLVVFNSCSHGGAVNIINEVKETFPEKNVYALIGGFHLFNKSAAEVREVAKGILKTGIQYVCTGHCTKEKAFAVLKEELGERLHQLKVGMVMEF